MLYNPENEHHICQPLVLSQLGEALCITLLLSSCQVERSKWQNLLWCDSYSLQYSASCLLLAQGWFLSALLLMFRFVFSKHNNLNCILYHPYNKPLILFVYENVQMRLLCYFRKVSLACSYISNEYIP